MKRLPLSPLLLLLSGLWGGLPRAEEAPAPPAPTTAVAEPVTAAATTASPTAGPDLSALEPAVAEQLKAALGTLEAERSKQDIDPVELATHYGELGRLYIAYELFEAAEPLFVAARELDGEDYRYLYHLAYVRERRGLPGPAIADYRATLEMRPGFGPARFRLARLLRQSGRLDEADRLIQVTLVDAVNVTPGLAALLAERGELRLAQGRPLEAIADLDLALAAVPEANRLHYPLAMAHRAFGDADATRRHMGQRGEVGLRFEDPMLDGIPGLAEGEAAYLLRGQMAYRAGDYPAAEAAFRKALEGQPESIRARVDLGTALAQQGKAAEARTEFEQVLQLAPDNVSARYNLALLLLQGGEPEAAVVQLQQGSELAPDDPTLHLLLAQVLQAAGQPEAALEQFKRTAQLSPTTGEAWHGGATILIGLGRYGEALQVLELAHQQLPQDGVIAHDLARFLAANPRAELRDGARAVDLAQRVLAALNSVDHAETLAMALAEAGQCEEAAKLQGQVNTALGEGVEEARRTQLQERLTHYQTAQPCRPAIDPSQPPAE